MSSMAGVRGRYSSGPRVWLPMYTSPAVMFAICYRCGYIHIGTITKPSHRRKIGATWKLLEAGEDLRVRDLRVMGPTSYRTISRLARVGPRKLGQRLAWRSALWWVRMAGWSLALRCRNAE